MIEALSFLPTIVAIASVIRSPLYSSPAPLVCMYVCNACIACTFTAHLLHVYYVYNHTYACIYIHTHVVCMHTLHSLHCPFILIFSPLEYPMPIGLSVCPCVCNIPLIGSYYIYCLLLFNTTIPDPLGLSVCRLLERTEVLCAQLRYVDKAFVHTKTWWSAQRLRGVDSHFVHGLCGTLRDCSFLQNVSWDGPHEAFAHCLCAPRPTFAQSLRAPPEVFVVHVGNLVDANHVCISSCKRNPEGFGVLLTLGGWLSGFP